MAFVRITTPMYIILTLLLQDLNTLCVMDHLQPLTLCPLHSSLSTLVPAMCNCASSVQVDDGHKAIVVIPRDHIVFMMKSCFVDCKF